MAASDRRPKARGALLKRDSACARTFRASAASIPARCIGWLERHLRIPRQVLEAKAADGSPEVFRRRVLQRVRLVEDDGVVARQHAFAAAPRGAQGEVREEEGMVDDNDVRDVGART